MNSIDPHIVIIGCGKLGSALAHALKASNYNILNVYSKTGGLRNEINTLVWDGKLPTATNLVFVAVQDDQISNLITEIINSDYKGSIVHVSGNTPLPSHPKTGVFYPLQTFAHSNNINWKTVPIFIETHTQEFFEILASIANKIGGEVIDLKLVNREFLHIAAVFANNFTNHLLSKVEGISDQQQLNFEWFYPLIETTLLNAKTQGAKSSQTGPAQRGDVQVIDKQIALLEKSGLSKEAILYKLLSQSILESEK